MKKTRQFSAVRTQPTASKAGFRQFPERACGVSPSTPQGNSATSLDTPDGATQGQSELLCFDRDIAEAAGVNAALLVKYVECSVRARYEQNPDKLKPMWNPRTVIAQALSLTEDQLRTAGRKATKAKLLGIRHNQHLDKTNHVLFYRLQEVDRFFASRRGVKPYWMRRDDFVELGACAAVLLHSFRYWQEQNSTVDGAFFEGRSWHHDDLKGLIKVYQGVFTARQIEDTLNHLVKIGRLLRRPFDPNNGRNPRRWFAVNDSLKTSPSAQANVVTEPLQTQVVSGARQIPNRSTSNPKSKHVESQLHNTNGTSTDALRADLAPLGQPSVQPKTNRTLRERPAVAPQAVGDSFEIQESQQKDSQQTKHNDSQTDPSSGLQTTEETVSEISQVDQQPNRPSLPISESLPVDVAENVNPVDLQTGFKSVDLRHDTQHEKLIANDREGNVRETFAECYREIFGGNPSHGLGQARQVLCAAHALNIPVRLYCLVSMVSWHMTNPDKPFPSQYLVGDKAIDRVKLWIDQCHEKFAAVDEKCMGLLFDQNESGGQVDWRQPEHPYKAILRHWAAEYRRCSEADFEPDQASIDTTISWLMEAAPQARSLGQFSEAHPKLRDVLDLITLNFEFAQEPYLTPQEFFAYYDQVKERLSARLRELHARRSRARRHKDERSHSDAGKESVAARNRVTMPSNVPPPGTRKEGAPVPPPRPRVTQAKIQAAVEQSVAENSQLGDKPFVCEERLSPEEEINHTWNEIYLKHMDRLPASKVSLNRCVDVIRFADRWNIDLKTAFGLLIATYRAWKQAVGDPDEMLGGGTVDKAGFVAQMVRRAHGKVTTGLVDAWLGENGCNLDDHRWVYRMENPLPAKPPQAKLQAKAPVSKRPEKSPVTKPQTSRSDGLVPAAVAAARRGQGVIAA